MLIIMALGLGVICCVVWRCRRCCCKRSRYRNQLPLHLHDSDDGSETCFDNEQQEGGEGMAMRSTLGAPRKYVNFEKAMQVYTVPPSAVVVISRRSIYGF